MTGLAAHGDRLCRFVEDAALATAEPERVRWIVVPAPLLDAEWLFEWKGAEPAVLWHERGVIEVGVGAIARLQLPSGSSTAGRDDRCAWLRSRAERLWRRVDCVIHSQALEARPRLYGGLSFAPDSASERPWRAFGEGQFVLPRMLYRQDGSGASVAVAIEGSATPEVIADRVGELRQLLEMKAAAARGSEPALTDDRSLDPAQLWRECDRERFADDVEAIRAAIAAGDVSKVVVARRLELAIEEGSLRSLLDRLRREAPSCTRFAIRYGSSTWIGATPERLVERAGRRVRTEALAGSIATSSSGDGRSAAALLGSEKDRFEHQLVVEHVSGRLSPLCARVSAPDEPVVRRLPTMLHLLTPFEGELRQRTHVLDLVHALHPTPAVGGVPSARAVDWILTNEPSRRGWYAGPVGWFDSGGDGSFSIALRSCLVSENRAYLFGGAGIVAASEPEAELSEIELKLEAMLRALGDARLLAPSARLAGTAPDATA